MGRICICSRPRAVVAGRPSRLARKAKVKPMKKMLVLAIMAMIIGIGLYSALTVVPAMPAKNLWFSATPVTERNGSNGLYSVIVSNCSGFSILYPFLGGTGPWFSVECLTNGQWHDCHVHGIGGGTGVMAPHETRLGSIRIPKEALAFRVGLHITSLTWRGRAAWSIGAGPLQRTLGPIAGPLLMPSDVRTRTKTEWSGEHSIDTAVSTNFVDNNDKQTAPTNLLQSVTKP